MGPGAGDQGAEQASNRGETAEKKRFRGSTGKAMGPGRRGNRSGDRGDGRPRGAEEPRETGPRSRGAAGMALGSRGTDRAEKEAGDQGRATSALGSRGVPEGPNGDRPRGWETESPEFGGG